MDILGDASSGEIVPGTPCPTYIGTRSCDYDVMHYVSRLPSVMFQCVGPKKRNRYGGESDPKSIPVFVSSDGDQIKVGLGDSQFARYPKETLARASVAEIEEFIAKALETAVTSYFSEIATLRDSELWD